MSQHQVVSLWIAGCVVCLLLGIGLGYGIGVSAERQPSYQTSTIKQAAIEYVCVVDTRTGEIVRMANAIDALREAKEHQRPTHATLQQVNPQTQPPPAIGPRYATPEEAAEVFAKIKPLPEYEEPSWSEHVWIGALLFGVLLVLSWFVKWRCDQAANAQRRSSQTASLTESTCVVGSATSDSGADSTAERTENHKPATGEETNSKGRDVKPTVSNGRKLAGYAAAGLVLAVFQTVVSPSIRSVPGVMVGLFVAFAVAHLAYAIVSGRELGE